MQGNELYLKACMAFSGTWCLKKTKKNKPHLWTPEVSFEIESVFTHGKKRKSSTPLHDRRAAEPTEQCVFQTHRGCACKGVNWLWRDP